MVVLLMILTPGAEAQDDKAREPDVKPPAPEKSKATQPKPEVRKVEVDGAKLEFTALPVAWSGERKPSSGWTVYEDRLWNSGFSPPYRLMKSGICEIAGKKIALDVSGLADPWVKEQEEIPKRFVHLVREPETSGERQGYHLWVIFSKRGALDYMVEWKILDGKSVRLGITDLGDEFPAWVK